MSSEFYIKVNMNPTPVEGIDHYGWVVYEDTPHFIIAKSHGMALSPERAFVEAKMHYDRIAKKMGSV